MLRLPLGSLRRILCLGAHSDGIEIGSAEPLPGGIVQSLETASKLASAEAAGLFFSIAGTPGAPRWNRVSIARNCH